MCRSWNLLRRGNCFLVLILLVEPRNSGRLTAVFRWPSVHYGLRCFTRCDCQQNFPSLQRLLGVSLVLLNRNDDVACFRATPFCCTEFIEWYIGPALTGLWGGVFCILAFRHNRTRNTTLSNIPNNGMNPSPQESQTSR